MRSFPANGDEERAVDVPVWGFAVPALLEQEGQLELPPKSCWWPCRGRLEDTEIRPGYLRSRKRPSALYSIVETPRVGFFMMHNGRIKYVNQRLASLCSFSFTSALL